MGRPERPLKTPALLIHQAIEKAADNNVPHYSRDVLDELLGINVRL